MHFARKFTAAVQTRGSGPRGSPCLALRGGSQQILGHGAGSGESEGLAWALLGLLPTGNHGQALARGVLWLTLSPGRSVLSLHTQNSGPGQGRTRTRGPSWSLWLLCQWLPSPPGHCRDGEPPQKTGSPLSTDGRVPLPSSFCKIGIRWTKFFSELTLWRNVHGSVGTSGVLIVSAPRDHCRPTQGNGGGRGRTDPKDLCLV